MRKSSARVSKSDPKGTKSEPKGAKSEPKGSQSEPKGAKRDQNGDQIQHKINIKEKVSKSMVFWSSPPLSFGSILGAFFMKNR